MGSNPTEDMDICCVLSGRGLCDEMITRSEEFYRLWRVVVCNHENLIDEEAIARYWAAEPEKQTTRSQNPE
jgi:hypothetical protein